MNRMITLAAASAVALATASQAHANDTSGQSGTLSPAEIAKRVVVTQQAEEAAKGGGEVISNGSPNSRAGAGYSTTSFQFSQEQGETSVSLALSIDMGSSKPDPTSRNFSKVSRSRLGIVATVPIEKDLKNSPLFAGDSFVSGTKLKLSYTRVSANLGAGADSWIPINLAYRKCASQQTESWRLSQPPSQSRDDAARDYLRYIDAELGPAQRDNIPAFERIFSRAPGDKSLSKAVFSACVPGNNADGTERTFADEGELSDAYLDRKTADALHRSFVPDNAHLSFWGLDASMGRDDKSFLDRTNFKLLSEPRTTWEVGVYKGWIGSDLTWSLRGRVVYGQTYKDNDEAEICRSVSIPVGGTDCIKGPDGAPIRERTGLASIEARKLVTVNDTTQIAIAPQVTYRFEDKNVGVEVPIYLVPDEKGKLSGGIKAVYNSKGDEFAVGLFVGVPFSVFY
jgi:hypothetical protein